MSPAEQGIYECSNEEELLRDEIESTHTNSGDSLVAMIASMNQTMAAMAGSIFSMGNALKRLHADTASPPNHKQTKTTTACHDEPCDEASLDESADSADSSELLQVTRAPQEPAARKGSSDVRDPSTNFLGNISQDYDVEEKTTEAVTAKLAEFVTERFSAKLGDGKFKEKRMAPSQTATSSLYQQ